MILCPEVIVTQRHIVIGLTGQTGAGKSTVCGFAEKLGAAVVNADCVAREVMQPGSPCLEELAKVFGKDILQEDGSLKRKLLAKRAFSDKEKTELLNSISHPFITARAKAYIEKLKKEGIRIIIYDAPQLFESGGDSLCDKVATVTAPEEVRIQRIMKRDNISRGEAELRNSAQHDEKFFIEHSDYIIDGAREPEKVQESVRQMLAGL